LIPHLGRGVSGFTALSGDGRFVAFVSSVETLVAGDTNRTDDVFVLDIKTGAIDRVSVANNGSQRTGWWADDPAISRDGRFVAFVWQNGLGDDGDITRSDIYVRDRLKQTTVLVSKSRKGGLSDGECILPSIAADGSRVTFSSWAKNLVAHDSHGDAERGVYVRSVVDGTTVRADLSPRGVPADGDSTGLISADGRSVVLSSDATNLVPHDTNKRADVFLRSLAAGTTVRVSVTSSGQQANGDSRTGSVSADGKRVAFSTDATNLIPGDANGVSDVVLRDVTTSSTIPVSMGPSGTPAPVRDADPLSDGIFDLVISGDGRHVVYSSNSAPLAGGRRYFGPEKPYQVYLWDESGKTFLVSDFGTISAQASISCGSPSITDDGGLIAFMSAVRSASDSDRNDWGGVFLCRFAPGT
jgi:Tol biopolymer transport system component